MHSVARFVGPQRCESACANVTTKQHTALTIVLEIGFDRSFGSTQTFSVRCVLGAFALKNRIIGVQQQPLDVIGHRLELACWLCDDQRLVFAIARTSTVFRRYSRRRASRLRQRGWHIVFLSFACIFPVSTIACQSQNAFFAIRISERVTFSFWSSLATT